MQAQGQSWLSCEVEDCLCGIISLCLKSFKKNEINVRIKILLVTTTYRYIVVLSCDAFSLVPSIWIVLDNQTGHGSVNFRTTSYLISVKTAWSDDRGCTNSVS